MKFDTILSPVSALSHVLELSSKVGLALTAVNRFETANTVLTQAAAVSRPKAVRRPTNFGAVRKEPSNSE